MHAATFFQAQDVNATFEVKLRNTAFLAKYIGRHPIRGWKFRMSNGGRFRITNLKQILRKVWEKYLRRHKKSPNWRKYHKFKLIFGSYDEFDAPENRVWPVCVQHKLRTHNGLHAFLAIWRNFFTLKNTYDEEKNAQNDVTWLKNWVPEA